MEVQSTVHSVVQSILTKQDLDQLASSIESVERKTSGELRLMIVRRSSRAGHALASLWLVLVSASLLVLWYLRHSLWLRDWPLLFNDPWWFIPAVLLVCGLAARVGARFPRVQRLFLTPQDMAASVWTRAELEFHREGLSETEGATGILIFLSLFERRAVVLADKAIASRLKPDTWNDVVSIVLAGARRGTWKSQLDQAIQHCGKILAEHFPHKNGDRNELPNTVIVKE